MNNVYVLWIDQAEYYYVCAECYHLYKDKQWTGSTRVADWNEHRKEVYKHAKDVEKCEICGKKIRRDK